jgi:hypothetical protein
LDEAVEQSALQGDPLPRNVVEPLKRGVNLRLESLEESDADESELRSHQGMDLARLMLRAEQEELLRIRTEQGLPDGIVRPMLEQLEIRRMALETHGDGSGHS